MNIIYARSVSEALAEALYKLKHGEVETSRNGNVIVLPEPLMTTYLNPVNRVLFSPLRNANPFFHLMESLWMLAGRDDLAYPLKFNSRFDEYSDNGKTLWGAYGYRWRNFFGYDQLKAIVNELRLRPNSRRAVLSMWNAMDVDETTRDAYGDKVPDCRVILPDSVVAANGGKDVPCNTHAYFDLRGGELNMTVCNRSNDAIWGAYGANAVHFSILLEYMAAWLGVPMGTYRQFSNNLHVYSDVLAQMVPGEDSDVMRLGKLAMDVEGFDRYNYMQYAGAKRVPLIDTSEVSWDNWHTDLNYFITRNGVHNEHSTWHSQFFREVAVPMYLAHDAWRNKQYDEAMEHAARIVSWDWRVACVEWLERKAAKRQEKVHAG